jgi:transcription initiation factor TFIIE subunit alpha
MPAKRMKLIVVEKKPQSVRVTRKKITPEMIQEAVTELVGEEALPVVQYLKGKSNVSEFIIAEDLDIEIHRCRNILYRCYEQQLATFKRKKDKKKGWYICYWNFNEEEVPHLLEKIKRDKTVKLKERLIREEGNTFFMCRNACARMDFEKATEFDYHCPECHDIMNQQDNSKTIAFLREKIKGLE